jgi:hypothetical protein
VIDADVGAHSVKPEAALEMIEHYYPNLPKIEGQRRNEWTMFNQLNEKILGRFVEACATGKPCEGLSHEGLELLSAHGLWSRALHRISNPVRHPICGGDQCGVGTADVMLRCHALARMA